MASLPKDKLKVYICPGADPSDVLTWAAKMVDITEYVQRPVSIEEGQRDESSEVGPTKCTLTVKNDDGRFSPSNPHGPWFGLLRLNTPLFVVWDNIHVRFAGTISEYPTRWLGIVDNSRVALVANGPLRRLVQTSDALQSALRRAVPSFSDVVAYWPMEEGPDADRFSSPTAGVPPILIDSDTTPAAVDGPGGSDRLPRFEASDTTTPRFFGGVPSFVPSSAGWRVDFLFRMDEQPESLDQIVLRIFTRGSTVYEWRITAGDDLRVLAFDRDRTELYNNGVTINSAFYGGWVRFMFLVENDGSDLRYTLWAYRPNGSNPILLNAFTEDVVAGSSESTGSVYSLGLQQSLGSWDGARSIGHLTVTNGHTDPFQNNADDGYADETAAARLERLCAEEGLNFTLFGSASETMRMGPQRPAALMDLLRDCEAADGGILHEWDGTLAYRARTNIYNQDPQMEIQWCQIRGNPEPTYDDQQIVNEVTVSRPGGSSATYRDEASITAEGVYRDSRTLHVASDALLRDIASWRVSLGTVSEDRWPRIPLKLSYDDDLISDWLALRIGDRITVEHEFPQMTGVAIDLLVVGWSERFTSHQWDVDLTCVPASPWRVAVLEGDDAERLDTDGSATASDFDAGTDTSLSVDVTDGPLWTTDDAEFPLEIEVAGVVLNVTDISGSSSPQTFTVDATPVNGVVKTIPAGSQVRVAHPIRLAL